MGTQQELTTEQIEILILINDICECIEEKDVENEFNTYMPETICGILCEENNESIETQHQHRVQHVCDFLEYYGYVDKKYFITLDGKQYLYLFKEYLDFKAKNPTVVHNSYSLINLGKLEFNLEACLGKISIAENIGNISKYGSSLLKKIKKAKNAMTHYRKKK